MKGSIELTSGSILTVSVAIAIADYISSLKAGEHLFGIATNEEYEDDNYTDYDYDDGYGSSYEKYGGYNGYDDDTIDDAFEGDPMNTWNVD